MPISRFADPALPAGGLTTSVVAVATDAVVDGAPVVGYRFGSFGRYAQGGLIRERFAPRLLAAGGDLEPVTAWEVMMAGERPGGQACAASPSARWTWRSGTLRRRSPGCPSTGT